MPGSILVQAFEHQTRPGEAQIVIVVVEQALTRKNDGSTSTTSQSMVWIERG